MRLAFYTYSYLDRLKLPVEACLERIAQTGYSGIDVSGTCGNSDNPRSFDDARRRLIRKTTEKQGLRVEAVITHAELTGTLFDPKREPLDLRGTIDLATDLGANVVTFHMGGVPAGTDLSQVWKKMGAAIHSAAEYGAARHVHLAVDGIWPTWIVDSPQSLERLFADVDSPNFGVNFDPSYLTLMGLDPVRFAARFGKRIVHGHLKDHRGSYPKWKHLMPGQGSMDYVRVLRALNDRGFEGSVAVECFTDMKFEQACDDCFAAMNESAKKAGVTFAR